MDVNYSAGITNKEVSLAVPVSIHRSAFALYKAKEGKQKKKTRSSASGDSGCIRSNPIVWSTSGSLAVGLKKKYSFTQRVVFQSG